MMARTHIKLATISWFIILGLVISFYRFTSNMSLNIRELFWSLAALFIARQFSILADIDSPYSRIGRKYYIKSLSPHRGPTHSALSIIILALISLPLCYFSTWLWGGVVIGHVSHIIGDLFTNKGVVLGYPWSKARVCPYSWSGTGSEYEGQVSNALSIAIIALTAVSLYLII